MGGYEVYGWVFYIRYLKLLVISYPIKSHQNTKKTHTLPIKHPLNPIESL